jgi:hypothetical protein
MTMTSIRSVRFNSSMLAAAYQSHVEPIRCPYDPLSGTEPDQAAHRNALCTIRSDSKTLNRNSPRASTKPASPL